MFLKIRKFNGHKNVHSKIINCILLAQKASENAKIYNKNFYYLKDKFIARAINLIKKNKNCKIRYYIKHGEDQNGQPCNIIYFEFNYKGDIKQISFHNFNNYKEEGDKTISWNHEDCSKTASIIMRRQNK